VWERILVDGLPDHHRRVAAIVCRRWRTLIARASPFRPADLRLDGRAQGALAAEGRLGLLTWIDDRLPRDDDRWTWIVRGAAAGDQPHVIEWARSQIGRRAVEEALPYEAAAGEGGVDALESLESAGYADRSGTGAMAAALAASRLDCAAWLAARGRPMDYAGACESAAARGDLRVLRWLRGLSADEASPHAGEWDPVPLLNAATRPEAVAWLLEEARGRRARHYVPRAAPLSG
jgi:hypothetical protein